MAKKKKKRIFIIIAAVIVILIIAVLIFSPKDSTAMYSQEAAAVRDISTYKSFTGNVAAEDEINVFAEVSQKVLSVNVSEGDYVNAGDVIAVLDSSDIEKNISAKESTMNSSDISDSYTINSNRQTYEDYKSGIENGNNSQINSARSTLESARSSLEAAEKKYNDAKEELENSTDSTLISAKSSVQRALTDLNNAKSDLDDAQKDYDDYLREVNEEDYHSIESYKEAVDTAYDNYNDKIFGRTDKALSEAKSKYDASVTNYSAVQSLVNVGSADSAALSEAKSEMETAKAEYEALLESSQTVAELKEAYEDALDEYERAQKNIDDTNNSQLSSYSRSYETARRTYESAVSSYETALQNLSDTEKSLNQNIESYYDSLVSAQKTYDDAVLNLETVQLSVEQTLESYKTAYEKSVELSGVTESERNELASLYEQLDSCIIKANTSGTVKALNLAEGEYSSANQKAAVIVDYSKLKISVKIDEYDITDVNIGDEVEVYINALDKTVSGRIVKISDEATVSGGVSYFEADISFDAGDDIKTGMSAEARLISGNAENAVSISVDAISFEDDNTAYVLVKNADGQLEKRYISIGVSDGTYAEITDGISEGDNIYFMSDSGFDGMIMFEMG